VLCGAAAKLGLYGGSIVNLDFHTAPHFGDESVLEKHWAGARGKKLLAQAEAVTDWKQIHIPHAKRKFPNPQIHESAVQLRRYTGTVRQVIVRGNGHEKPTFLIGNDFDTPVEPLVGNYSGRWRVENGIAEGVKFFNLNSLSSPILVKIHFDIAVTMIADAMYTMLADKLRGFEDCDAPKLYRHFIRGKGTLDVCGNTVTVTYPRRAHNPILRAVPWSKLPTQLPGLEGASLKLRFA